MKKINLQQQSVVICNNLSNYLINKMKMSKKSSIPFASHAFKCLRTNTKLAASLQTLDAAGAEDLQATKHGTLSSFSMNYLSYQVFPRVRQDWFYVNRYFMVLG